MNNKKICSFYISEFHLLTILLPYINEKITENEDVKVILQKDITNNVKTYLKNIKNLKFNNEKIINLGWENVKPENINKSELKKNIVVIGDNDYINNVNNSISNFVEMANIIDCYKIDNVNRFDNILENYNCVLNTKGIESFSNFSQNAQKNRTVKTQI